MRKGAVIDRRGENLRPLGKNIFLVKGKNLLVREK